MVKERERLNRQKFVRALADGLTLTRTYNRGSRCHVYVNDDVEVTEKLVHALRSEHALQHDDGNRYISDSPEAWRKRVKLLSVDEAAEAFKQGMFLKYDGRIWKAADERWIDHRTKQELERRHLARVAGDKMVADSPEDHRRRVDEDNRQATEFRDGRLNELERRLNKAIQAGKVRDWLAQYCSDYLQDYVRLPDEE